MTVRLNHPLSSTEWRWMLRNVNYKDKRCCSKKKKRNKKNSKKLNKRGKGALSKEGLWKHKLRQLQQRKLPLALMAKKSRKKAQRTQ